MKAFEKDPYFGVQTAKALEAATGIGRRSASAWFRRMRKKEKKRAQGNLGDDASEQKVMSCFAHQRSEESPEGNCSGMA